MRRSGWIILSVAALLGAAAAPLGCGGRADRAENAGPGEDGRHEDVGGTAGGARQLADKQVAGSATLDEKDGPVQGTITVCAASSLRDALTTLAARYEELHPSARVRLSFGASSALARQILEGAPADVFLSADSRAMDVIDQRGLLSPGTRIDLLSNSLVVIVPAAAATVPHTPEDLAAPAIQRIALCDEAVPLGHYARGWLGRRGILGRIRNRAVRPDDARAALALVEAEAVDAALVYRTDARAGHGVRIAFEVPIEETPGIVYPGAVLSGGPNPEGGRGFLSYAASSPAIWIFRGAGFTVLPSR